MRWKTYKLERHTQSTLAAELMSLARGVAECEWLRSLMAEALHADYTLEKDKKLRERESWHDRHHRQQTNLRSYLW